MSNPFMPTRQAAPAQMSRPTNPMQMAQSFQQFVQGFQGDPKAEVQRLLDSGEMSQDQYQFIMGQIQQRMPFMGRR